jgi:hypothetical protein
MTECDDKPTSQALAAKVVAYRALGIFKDEAREAMIELAKRKDEGDDFDFDKFIADKLAEVPKPQMKPEVMKFLSSLASMGSIK